ARSQNSTLVYCLRLPIRVILATMNTPDLPGGSAAAGSPGTLERRTEPRVSVDIEACLKCLNPLTSTGPSARIRIVELSYHGMKLRMTRELLLGGLVQIIVGNKVFMGKVRHTTRRATEFEIGIQLTERIPSTLT